ncbi:PAR bZIP family member Pdp1 isoform 7-T7 [Glossina fuscipes fuscipes]
MTSETTSCSGFFQEHANTVALNQYFQQLNSQAAAAAAAANVGNISVNNDSGSESSIMSRNTNASIENGCNSGNNSEANKSLAGGTITATGGSSNNQQWNNMQQQQHQQQQTQLQHHLHQQQHQQQQQQHHHQQQQHNHHHQQHQQQHHTSQQQHQQHQQQQQQQQQQHQQQQTAQHHHHHHQTQQQSLHQSQQQHPQQQQHQQQQQLSAALSQTLQQNLAATTSNVNVAAAAAAAAAAATVSTNPHSIFGTGNFHYKTNNSWSIPSLSCYQRLYNENAHYHAQRNFNANSTETSTNINQNVSSLVCNNNNNNINNNNNTVGNGNANANNSSNANTNSVLGNVSATTTVQHVANAVAAAVIANEHQNHLNNLKSRFQPTSTGRKSPFLGFICKTNGKSTSNSKEVICPDDKYKEEGDLWNVEAQTAFLGPNLWEKTLPYDADLKVTQYADLDEFLSENNIPDGLPGTHLGHSSSLSHRSDSLSHAAGLSLGLGHITTKRERSPSPSDCISPDTLNPPSPAESIFDIPAFSFASSGRDFDPRTRAFSDEELKPQPMIKKSRKQFVPDELKDDKYWARRRKNNIAAKRSRDARRQKENQIAMRARYLEKENATLHQEVEQLKQENMDLRARLSKFQDV